TFTNGISACFGSGNVGVGPVPAVIGSFAAPPQAVATATAIVTTKIWIVRVLRVITRNVENLVPVVPCVPRVPRVPRVPTLSPVLRSKDETHPLCIRCSPRVRRHAGARASQTQLLRHVEPRRRQERFRSFNRAGIDDDDDRAQGSEHQSDVVSEV